MVPFSRLEKWYRKEIPPSHRHVWRVCYCLYSRSICLAWKMQHNCWLPFLPPFLSDVCYIASCIFLHWIRAIIWLAQLPLTSFREANPALVASFFEASPARVGNVFGAHWSVKTCNSSRPIVVWRLRGVFSVANFHHDLFSVAPLTVSSVQRVCIHTSPLPWVKGFFSTYLVGLLHRIKISRVCLSGTRRHRKRGGNHFEGWAFDEEYFPFASFHCKDLISWGSMRAYFRFCFPSSSYLPPTKTQKCCFSTSINRDVVIAKQNEVGFIYSRKHNTGRAYLFGLYRSFFALGDVFIIGHPICFPLRSPTLEIKKYNPFG